MSIDSIWNIWDMNIFKTIFQVSYDHMVISSHHFTLCPPNFLVLSNVEGDLARAMSDDLHRRFFRWIWAPGGVPARKMGGSMKWLVYVLEYPMKWLVFCGISHEIGWWLGVPRHDETETFAFLGRTSPYFMDENHGFCHKEHGRNALDVLKYL